MYTEYSFDSTLPGGRFDIYAPQYQFPAEYVYIIMYSIYFVNKNNAKFRIKDTESLKRNGFPPLFRTFIAGTAYLNAGDEIAACDFPVPKGGEGFSVFRNGRSVNFKGCDLL